MGLCFLIRLAVPKYNQLNEALECRKKKIKIQTGGKWSPMFVTLSCTYRAASVPSNLAVRWVGLSESTGASVCVRGDARVLRPCELMGESLRR